MTEYTVDLHLKVRGDKPVKTNSIVEARRISVEMLLGGLTTPRRYNYVKIYEGKVTPKSRPKYIVQATNYYGGKVNPYWTDFRIYSEGINGWTNHLLYSDGTIQKRRK